MFMISYIITSNLDARVIIPVEEKVGCTFMLFWCLDKIYTEIQYILYIFWGNYKIMILFKSYGKIIFLIK